MTKFIVSDSTKLPQGMYLGKIVEFILSDELVYAYRPPKVDPEVAKLVKAQPTRPNVSHEPWKQSVKRRGRNVGKSK